MKRKKIKLDLKNWETISPKDIAESNERIRKAMKDYKKELEKSLKIKQNSFRVPHV